jgi:hypothetical protein
VSRSAVHEPAAATEAPHEDPAGSEPVTTGSAPTIGRTPVLRLAVQRLPEVSEPQDQLEVEADRAAQRIVAGQSAGPISAVGGGPQRLAVGLDEPETDSKVGAGDDTVHRWAQRLRAGAERSAVTPGVASTLRNPSGGAPIPDAVRSTIEPALGADLGGVQVHEGPEAQDTAARLGARALTYGPHVFLGRDASPHDVPLMAHEATHVVQQGASAAGDGQVQRLPDLITDKLASYARHVPGYTLCTVIVGVNPLTGEDVDRNAMTLVEGVLGLVPFGTLLFDKLVELGVIQAAFAYIDRELATFDLSIARIERLISEAWDEMDFVRLDPFAYNLNILVTKFSALLDDVVGFIGSLMSAVLELVKDAVLDLADQLLAENPAWALIKKVLHYDPLRGEPVEASTVEILEDFLRLIGRETELEQMRTRGTLTETADWIDTQLVAFESLATDLGALFAAAWEAIQPENLPNLTSALQTLAAQAFGLLQRAWDFAGTVAAKVLELVKDALLAWLSDFAAEVPGFHLMTVILGRNPFTGAEVPRTAENIIRGFITLLPGGNATYDQLVETGVVGQAAANIEGAMASLGISWEMVTGLFRGIWDGLSIDDLVDPIGAFVRIRDQFGEPISRLFAFVVVVVREVVQLILVLMNFPTELLSNIITNAMQAFDDITRDPIGFLINLLAAVKEGFARFFANIGEHLLSGLTAWLFRGLRAAGVEPPTELTLASGLNMLMQVLGITAEKLWTKLAERIGPERVAQIRGALDVLTGIWGFVRDVQEKGVWAIWEYIQSQLSNLWSVILQHVTTWIMEKIVIRVSAYLLSLIDPSGIIAVINGCVAFFNLIQSAVEYIRDMLEIVDSFVGTVAAIARGDIEPGAVKMEQSLADAMPVAIGFLAYQVGLGNVGDKIAEIVGGLREMVDKALDWLLDQAEKLLQSVLKMLGLGEKDEPTDPNDHEAIANRVVDDMLKPPAGVTDYPSLRTAKTAQADQLEQHYSAILGPDVALTISFLPDPTDVTDADVDFSVLIAPNDTKKTGSVGLANSPVALKKDDEVYIRVDVGGPEEHGRFVDSTVFNGATYYRFSISRLYQSEGKVLILPSDTTRYRRTESGPHTMNLRIVIDGIEVASSTFVSGNMTKEEAELGFPLNMLATHTEARALTEYAKYIKDGAHWILTGFYLPCSSCKGKMNKAAKNGAVITYEPGSFTASSE